MRQNEYVIINNPNKIRPTTLSGVFCSADGKFYRRISGNLYRVRKLNKPHRCRQYPTISVVMAGKETRASAPREIYETWVREIKNTDVVVPIDGDWFNLNVSNLKTVSRSEALRPSRERYAEQKYTAECVLKELSVRKKEIDLAINFATTGDYSEINNYVNAELFKSLCDYGMMSIKNKGKQTILDAAAESIAVLYDMIDSNRAVTYYTGICRSAMRRYCRSGKHIPEYRYALKKVSKPIDDINFEALAKKYGLL